jgi:protein gp37
MSKIEWTEKTWNPVTGCTKISDGCLNCYAKRMAKLSKWLDTTKKQLLKSLRSGLMQNESN